MLYLPASSSRLNDDAGASVPGNPFINVPRVLHGDGIGWGWMDWLGLARASWKSILA